MAHARSRGRARRPGNNMPHNGWLIFNRPEQHWFFRLLGLIIRARAELTLITVTVTVYMQLGNYDDPHDVLIGMGVVTIAVFAIPPTRRYLWRRIWCVITRRRLRACMMQTFTMARANGRLPFLLWARPSPVGEHVLVWLPAGMAVKDLERITGELAAACWATDARILPSKRRAFLAHIHVIRRDTLGAVGLSPEVIDELDNHTSGRRARRTRPPPPRPRTGTRRTRGADPVHQPDSRYRGTGTVVVERRRLFSRPQHDRRPGLQGLCRQAHHRPRLG